MAKNYSYPRVTISQYAKTRSSAAPAVEDTTVLFMPFIAEKGPFGVDEKGYYPIHGLAEFIDKFGNLKFEDNGQTALVIYNWLNAGGTLFPYRLSNAKKDKEFAKFDTGEFVAKYAGTYYNNIKIQVSLVSAGVLSITVNYSENGKTTTLESMRVTPSNYQSVISASSYIVIGEGFADLISEGTFTLGNDDNGSAIQNVTYSVSESNKAETTADSLETLLTAFWGNDNSKESYMTLANSLEAPVDVIMDAGYSNTIKDAMISFISNAEGADSVRNDIVGLFDNHVITPTSGKYTGTEIPRCDNDSKYNKSAEKGAFQYAHTNVAVWDQYFVIEDAIFTDKDINVTPTYFLSRLIPYNDIVYGVQYPTAGLRRGILEDAKKVFTNPTPDKKETKFKNRINYCEKSSREYAFMSQRTWDASTEEGYTSLSFLNNVRALERMKKDLHRLGREYLFEHNDSVTLSQMSNVLNRYMATWTANRTLSFAEVTVAPNAWSTEAVDVTLVIRFNNTIEVISVDITIE